MRHAPPDIGAYLAERLQADLSNVHVKSIAEGAATTEPALLDRETLYLEDCGVAKLLDAPTHHSGVIRFALDRDSAARLWREAERLTGRTLPLG